MLAKELSKIVGVSVREDYPSRRETTFMVGGAFQHFLEIDSPEALPPTIKLLASNQQSYKILGAGSNLLVPDEGVQGWVLRLGRTFRYYKALADSHFEVGGAMPLMQLSKELSQSGFSGLEYAAGIPASFGGAVWMNAGAHGGETGSVIEKIYFIDSQGNEEVVNKSQLDFSYRHTNLPNGIFIHKVEIKLVPGDVGRIMQLREKNLEYRKATQPLSKPCAGSVFRNPSKEQPAGMLIEKSGLKGRQIGGAKVSELHANWIINEQRQASAEDVLALIKTCQESVKSQFGLELRPEVVCW